MAKNYTLIGGNGTHVSPLSVTENDTYTAGDSKAFNPVIVNVPASAVDSGTKSITSNGDNQDVVGYAAVDVAVPNSYTAGDEGKVVSNGALVAQTAHAEVTQNGTIDTTLNNSVKVNVSGGGDLALANVAATFESGFVPVDFGAVAVYQDELVTELYFNAAGTAVLDFVMWKGHASAELSTGTFDPYDKSKVSVSGGVAIIEGEDEWWLDITGDGTITFSA